VHVSYRGGMGVSAGNSSLLTWRVMGKGAPPSGFTTFTVCCCCWPAGAAAAASDVEAATVVILLRLCDSCCFVGVVGSGSAAGMVVLV
jgi:hypothetical protein